jgi:hypothetical protein
MSRDYAGPLGGITICRPEPFLFAPQLGRDSQGLRLLSDLHLGASNTDEALITRELEDARCKNDRVILGGDVFDAIFPGDRRYQPHRVVEAIRHRTDAADAAVEYAARFLGPYADLIDVVGCGNHESAVEERRSVDLIRQLIRLLKSWRKTDRPLLYGGYTAFIEYAWKPVGRRGSVPLEPWKIWYHHGAGRGGSAALSLGKLAKQSVAFEADLYWSGHTHARAAASEVRVTLPRNGNRIRLRDVRLLVTGSYLLAYPGIDSLEVEEAGRQGNYAADSGLVPHGLGGARVVLSWGDCPESFAVKIEQ